MAGPTDKELSAFEGGPDFDSHAEPNPDVNQDPVGAADEYDSSDPSFN